MIPGTATFTTPADLADEWYAYGLSGTWNVTEGSITAQRDAVITLNYTAHDAYLDLSGTGSITVTAGGTTKKYAVSGAPNIYTVIHGPDLAVGTVKVSLSPGLSAYSFTFG
ncbi:hypothetical protein [Actinoplanes sp. RD1]|uniref:hypothetical protein n=1 Tax=Actinoplanes sp. RD1 TaxID=3064538 RepID=UPI0027418CA3|nr:hypothetical protein [Actinoplanes sp. RD1]